MAIAFVAAEPKAEAKPDVLLAAEPVSAYIGTTYHGNYVYPSAYTASYVASPYAYTSRYAYSAQPALYFR